VREFLRVSMVQPGRFAQGPEEKCADFGRAVGFAVIAYPSR
jgi:hypothetical protein